MAEPTLDEALSGTETAEVETGETPGTTETAEVATGEETKPDAPPAPESKSEPEPSPKESAAISQARDERQKRQKLERQLGDIQRKLDEKDAPVRPSVLDDEDGAFNHLQQSVQSTIVTERIGISREFMLSMKDDYEELEGEFLDLVVENPSLRDEMVAHPMPAKFVYETARKRRELKEMDNMPDFKAKLKAELRAEVLAELKGEVKDEQDAKAEATAIAEQPSLAESRSTGSEATPVDESLEDILGR